MAPGHARAVASPGEGERERRGRGATDGGMGSFSPESLPLLSSSALWRVGVTRMY